MKSRFYLAFILAGIVPVLGLAGFYVYTTLSEPPAPVAAPPAVAVNPAQQQVEVVTIASSLFNAIKSTNADASGLSAKHAPAEVDTFIHTHTGVSGVVLLDSTGKPVRTMPPTPALVDANYGSSPEFAKIQDKFKANPAANYEFYTSRLGYPAFVFAVPLPSGYSAQVILNVTQFFKGSSPNGQYFILDAGSGHYLYHSDPAQLSSTFNAQNASWLNQVSTDLSSGKNGVVSGPGMGAAYGYLGFGKFGVVHVFPLTLPAPAPVKAAAKKDLADIIDSAMALAFVLALALLCIGAAIASRLLAAPLRRAADVILAAAEDPATLTPEAVKSFGSDEAGSIIQAMSLYNEKQQERLAATTRNLTDQLTGLQRQTRQYQSEAQEKSQQLGDKMKELDALKGMTEGLRHQSEQAKNEVAHLKSDLATAQAAQIELTALQGKFTQLQAQLKTVEAKAAESAANATSIQVSQVRAAAIRTMAEELKNTLQIIKGYVSQVIGTGQGTINEKQQEFLGMVINRSARLEKFINDLVDMYQVEIEQKDVKVDEVDLPREIEGLAFNFQTQTELKNLKFKVDAKPGLPKVPIVKRRLTQLWNVLYLQLIKDAPKGTTIPIVVEPLGNNVRVTLQDPGLTVSAEGLPKFFDEFYDPKHPASPQLAGTGLKMSLVKTILTAQGGSARAEKAEPGTRLILTFATKRGESPSAVPAVASAGVASATTPAVASKPTTSTTPASAGAKPGLDLDSAFGVAGPKPASATPAPAGPPATPSTPPTGITVGSKIPTSGTAAGAIAPPPGFSAGSKIPGLENSPLSTVAPLPSVPAASATPGVIPAKPAGNVLDALISGKIPSVTAPGLKPSAPAASTPAPVGTPAPTATPGPVTPAPAPAMAAPKPPVPAVPGAPGAPLAPPAAKPPVPGVPPTAAPAAMAAPASTVAPKPPVPAAPAPPVPGVPPGVSGAPKPPAVSLDALLNKAGAPPAAGAPAPPAPPNIQGTKPPAPPSPPGDDLLE